MNPSYKEDIMKHFFTSKVKAVLIAAVLIAAVLAVVSNLTGRSVPDILVQDLLSPLRSGVNSLTLQAERIYDYIFGYEMLEAENAVLKDKLAQMEDSARKAADMARENERLRKLLELKAANEDYQLVDTYIIARSSNDWTSTLTINRGTNAGIQIGMCAITEEGAVVGLVTEVGSNYAVIKSVLDASLDISGTIATSGYSGMVHGGYTTGQENLLLMEYLPSSAVIRTGDEVVTAGSTVYPRNLILGNVAQVGVTDTGVAKYAYLTPAADIASLEQVFIITEFAVE